MFTRWQSAFAAGAVTLVTIALVALDLTDRAFRQWWAGRPLTTDTVAGMLVLLITVLVVNQVVSLRHVNDRSRAVAAQTAIMMSQAARSSRTASAALDGSGDRDAASDEFRTYMMMLLVGAALLIDEPVSRNFLERAQYLGGQIARALSIIPGATPPSSGGALDAALEQLRAAAAPLLQLLNLEELTAATGDSDV